jgi:hypothetical protein
MTAGWRDRGAEGVLHWITEGRLIGAVLVLVGMLLWATS